MVQEKIIRNFFLATLTLEDKQDSKELEDKKFKMDEKWIFFNVKTWIKRESMKLPAADKTQANISSDKN